MHASRGTNHARLNGDALTLRVESSSDCGRPRRLLPLPYLQNTDQLVLQQLCLHCNALCTARCAASASMLGSGYCSLHPAPLTFQLKTVHS